MEAYPALGVEIIGDSPGLVAEIRGVCQIHHLPVGGFYVELPALNIIFYFIWQRNIVQLGDNHPVILAVIHSMEAKSVEMVIYIGIGEIPEDFKCQVVCHKPVDTTTKCCEVCHPIARHKEYLTPLGIHCHLSLGYLQQHLVLTSYISQICFCKINGRTAPKEGVIAQICSLRVACINGEEGVVQKGLVLKPC
jgi:hypothetical protein